MAKHVPDISHLAQSGARLAIRVTPKASRNEVKPPENPNAPIRVYVTVVPEGGKANDAVLKMLAKALGLPKSRLRIVQGVNGRDKLVEVS